MIKIIWKIDTESNYQIEKWVNFIRNPEVEKMDETDEAIKKARKVLKEISQDNLGERCQGCVQVSVSGDSEASSRSRCPMHGRRGYQ